LSKYIDEGERDQRNYHTLEPYLYHLKGNLLMHHLKFSQAISEFTKASNTFKSHYQERVFLRGFRFSLFNIGLCYQKMSQHQEAIKKYMDLVQHHVKNVEVLNALGNAFIELALQEPQKPSE
jgi:tetratricopeptide (TPR) repeat protein